ncbi:hypothetical protein BDF14DRAFT_1732003 [Spinellus fusiger]|nr:hypothetical protein BDF14DRAFT_1732003 [Spinellus fusiger]
MSKLSTVYRQLLREIHIQYTQPSKDKLFFHEVMQLFRQGKTVKDPVQAAAMVRNAEHTLNFLTSSRKHKTLREQYSAIVLEQKKRIEMSAHRVGLEMPKPYDPNVPLPGMNKQ